MKSALGEDFITIRNGETNEKLHQRKKLLRKKTYTEQQLILNLTTNNKT